MDFIGIDLHKVSSQVCILSEDGELTDEADALLEKTVKEDEVVKRLCTTPGVGPVTATTFAAMHRRCIAVRSG